MPDLEYYLAQARRIEEHREAQAEVGMRKAFKNLLKNLQGFLGEEYANHSENGKLSYEILQKKARYARFIDEVEKKVIKGTEESSNIVKKTVDDTYKAAFDGMIDAVKKADGNSEELKKAFKSVKYVKPETLKKAVENPVSGLTLKDTLEKNRAEIVYNIKQTVGIGLQNGDRYETMAKRVAESLDGDYQKAIRIVRTETHRVQQAGKLESALAIDEKLKKGNSGMRYYKIWRTSKDERVRKPKGKNKANHRKMEGVTILVDEEFDLGHGVKAMAPGMSGDAGNDINCRCRLSFRLKKAEKNIEKPAEENERIYDPKKDEEYQEQIRKRREMYHKRHQKRTEDNKTDNDKSFEVKAEINKLLSEKSDIEKKLDAVKEREKELTNKVFFTSEGTKEEKEELLRVVAERKAITESLNNLNNEIYEKQNIYKTAAEQRLMSKGVVKEVKLSKKMSPDTVDELEKTLNELYDKYGMMPEAVIYSPKKVEDATARYNWFDDKIYLSNRFNSDKYLEEFVKKSEESYAKYYNNSKFKEYTKKKLEEAEKVLADKSIKGYEREKALIEKAEAQIDLNFKRFGVRENIADTITHEYGHFIHRHCNVNYPLMKETFKAKELGGKFYCNEWCYDINAKKSREAKVVASEISKYATESPLETFAEGFLAMEKGERIPSQIEDIINEAKVLAKKNYEELPKILAQYDTKAVEKSVKSGIIKEKDISKYIGKKIVDTDNQSIREWYVANVSDIPNQINKSKSFEEQVKQAFDLRNKYKHEARIAMSDKETVEMLERKRPAPTFEQLLQSKMKRKNMTKEDALKDILKTASKTNEDVNKEFGL